MQLMTLIGFILPPFIDLINNHIKDNYARFWVSVAFCTVIGFGIEYLTNNALTIEGVSAQILTVFGLAQISYKAIWEGSDADLSLKGV